MEMVHFQRLTTRLFNTKGRFCGSLLNESLDHAPEMKTAKVKTKYLTVKLIKLFQLT